MLKVCAVAGIGITIVGYYLDKAERFDWAMRIFTPQYVNALHAYETTLEKHTWVEKDQPGFDQLSELLRPKLSGDGDITIAKLRVTHSGWSVEPTDKGMESGPKVTIEIVLADGRSIPVSEFEHMREQIKSRYYDDTVLKLGHIIFLCGIVISILVLIPFLFGKTKTTCELQAEQTDGGNSR